jgi:hypothetical protein
LDGADESDQLIVLFHDVAAQVEIESKIEAKLKAVYNILVSSA